MDKVDFVFPFVDCNETVWQETYREERRKQDLPTEINKVRYREWGNLKYLLRGIEKFMPWIGNVYIIVSNKEQIPDWVNTNEVKVVLHSDIIPPEFLPTFNSCTIEMFLGNIKGLSERFIYGNDDMFPLKPMTEEEFYTNAIPKLSVKTDSGLNTMFKKVEWKTLRIIGEHFGKELPDPEQEFLKLPHTIVPMTKETTRICGKFFKPEIYSSISSFRKNKNINQYLYTYYQLFSGNYLDGNRSYKYVSFKGGYPLDKAEEIATSIRNQTHETICINDCLEFETDEIFEAVKAKINAAFEEILPNPSKYELSTSAIENRLNIFKWLNKIGATFVFKNDAEVDTFINGVTNTIKSIENARNPVEDTSHADSTDSES